MFGGKVVISCMLVDDVLQRVTIRSIEWLRFQRNVGQALMLPESVMVGALSEAKKWHRNKPSVVSWNYDDIIACKRLPHYFIWEENPRVNYPQNGPVMQNFAVVRVVSLNSC